MSGEEWRAMGMGRVGVGVWGVMKLEFSEDESS